MGNTTSGYYNLYDSSKQYSSIMFLAGKVLQSKEINELQSMVQNQIKNVGDTILTDGDVIEGCQLITDVVNKRATLTSGKIYLSGDVRTIVDTQIVISGVGTEIIGAIIKKEVITPDIDPTLLDIATGFDNYNQDGAYRLKETVEITVNDPLASVLFTLVNGELLNTNVSEDLTQLDKFNTTLARRTYDESGNYKVEGLKLLSKNFNDETNIYVTMEKGKAYVRGYEVVKLSSSTIPFERPTAVKKISNEPKIYRTGTSEYVLNNKFVKTLLEVVGVVEASMGITRGGVVGGTDYLPFSPVVEIVSVSQGGTTYTQGVDYQLSEDGVSWSLNGSEPSPGTTYQVVWNYNKTMVGGTDYTLVSNSDNTSSIVFTQSGDKPVNGTTFSVDYEFLLARRDTLALSYTGEVIVTKGQPDELRVVESPSVNSEDLLILGSVLLTPNSDEITIFNNNTQSIPMLDLYKMLNRINALEYNQSISDLDNEAAEGESATELMGVFTDGFLGLSKADVNHPEWSASIDLDYQELTLPFNSTVSPLAPNPAAMNAGLFNRLLTAPYEEVSLFSQLLATGVMRVNSYDAFPKSPTIKIEPEVDNWIDETEVIVDGGTRTRSVTLRRWWYHKNAAWAQEEKALWQSYGLEDGGQSLGWNSTTVTNTQSIVNSILDEAILYMRENTIHLLADNLEPGADNIIVTFDENQVQVTPISPEYQGTTPGTLKANLKGVTEGTFVIPKNTLCGTKEVRLYPENTPSLAGIINYTANGRTITTIKTVFTEIVSLNPTDPLAQSFQFDQDQFITGVGIYFQSKDNIEPITVQLRNMVNGYPGTTIFSQKVVSPDEIVVSVDGSVEKRIEFDDPVLCRGDEQYCFTVLSNSSVDSIFIAETTKVDIGTGTQVSKNPYLNGTLFSSSNAITWTAHQSSDMKFNLYGAKFETSGSCEFLQISPTSLTGLMIASEESIPTGCSVSWRYSINGETPTPIEIYDDRDLSKIAQTVDVDVTFVSKINTSPAIALDSLILAGFENLQEGVYVSKNVSVPDGYNNVKQIIDLHLPTGTNVNMFFASDTSGTIWTPLESVSVTQKSSEYKTYTFEKDSQTTLYNYRVKVELSTVNVSSRPKAQNLRSIMKTI